MDQSRLATGTPETTDFAHGAPTDSSPISDSAGLGQRGRARAEDYDDVQPHHSLAGEDVPHNIQRSDSVMSQSQTLTPSRGGTLKKKQSLKKSGSFRRSSSRRSNRPGSVRSVTLGEREKYAEGDPNEMMNSPFYIPVPTTGNPTEILADRFQAWRKVLKDLITYYRDIQKSYDARSKALFAMSNTTNSTSIPPVFLPSGGIGDATQILNKYHKQALAENNRARSIEEDVVVQLSGLRSDLQQKIKEIKHLSGDFKNNVDKETEATRKAVASLQEVLAAVDREPAAASGRDDPYIVRLGVDRQIERQIDEENYLHRAFLNLENSGRELESIVVGEIQKAYNAYASILKREADEAYETVEALKEGPLAMTKDHEWDAFVNKNEHFVDPKIPPRSPENIHYPGKDAPAAAEIRSGMLERKTKYLKSYTPGWFVLSPTHLHEFKSPDLVQSQTPVMSLYLPEQKLGSHSNVDSSSHKFILKGRQTGGMHRGHSWVLRAESRDTMLAWYGDIKSLIEKTGEERNAFVRRHARSVSGGSHKAGSVSSDGGMDEDEADEVPYSGTASQFDQASPQGKKLSERPQPGGRFPSELNIDRDLRVPLSPSSGTGSDDRDVIAAAGALPGSHNPFDASVHQERDREHGVAPGVMAAGLSRGQSEMSQKDSRIHFKREEQRGEYDRASGLAAGNTARMHSQENQKEAYVPTSVNRQEDDFSGTTQGPAGYLSRGQSQMSQPAGHRGIETAGMQNGNLGAVRGPGGDLSRGQSEVSQRQSYVPISAFDQHNNLPVEQGPRPLTAAHRAPQHQQSESTENLDTQTDSQPAAQQFPKSNTDREQNPSFSAAASASTPQDHDLAYRKESIQYHGVSSDALGAVAFASRPSPQQSQLPQATRPMLSDNARPNSNYGEWMAPAAAGIGGTVAGITGTEAYRHHQQTAEPSKTEPETAAPAHPMFLQGIGSVPPPSQAPPTLDSTELTEPDKPENQSRSGDPPTFTPNEPSGMTTATSTSAQPILSTSQASAASENASSSTEVQKSGSAVGQNQQLTDTLPSRPKLTKVETLSDLHVPGEFPRSSPASAMS